MEGPDVGSRPGGSPSSIRYRGQRLGLPESGPGSMAGTWARVVALGIDWIAAMFIARALSGDAADEAASFATLGVFGLQVALLTWLSGGSFGQRIVGIRVVGRTRRLGPARSAVRTLLICLAIPPLIWDADGRGLHDRAVDSVVVRA